MFSAFLIIVGIVAGSGIGIVFGFSFAMRFTKSIFASLQSSSENSVFALQTVVDKVIQASANSENALMSALNGKDEVIGLLQKELRETQEELEDAEMYGRFREGSSGVEGVDEEEDDDEDDDVEEAHAVAVHAGPVRDTSSVEDKLSAANTALELHTRFTSVQGLLDKYKHKLSPDFVKEVKEVLSYKQVKDGNSSERNNEE